MSIDSQNSAKVSHILGIDFGTSKIGLALADAETKIAFAYAAIKNDKDFLDNLSKIIKEENIKTVVIGRAGYIYDQNVETRLIASVESLKKLGVNVEFHEEMFTTKMAQDNLKEKGAKNIQKYDDREAARIILQSWLDKL